MVYSCWIKIFVYFDGELKTYDNVDGGELKKTLLHYKVGLWPTFFYFFNKNFFIVFFLGK